MLLGIMIPNKNNLWAEAINTANYIRNRTHTNSCKENKTPFKTMHENPPNLSHMRVFRCDAYAHTPKQKRQQKLGTMSKKGYFVGYDKGKAYRIYFPDAKNIIISKDVDFNESSGSQHSSHKIVMWSISTVLISVICSTKTIRIRIQHTTRNTIRRLLHPSQKWINTSNGWITAAIGFTAPKYTTIKSWYTWRRTTRKQPGHSMITQIYWWKNASPISGNTYRYDHANCMPLTCQKYTEKSQRCSHGW